MPQERILKRVVNWATPATPATTSEPLADLGVDLRVDVAAVPPPPPAGSYDVELAAHGCDGVLLRYAAAGTAQQETSWHRTPVAAERAAQRLFGIQRSDWENVAPPAPVEPPARRIGEGRNNSGRNVSGRGVR